MSEKIKNGKIETTKLVMIVPVEMDVGRKLKFEVRAINDKGVQDTTRNDLIKITLNGKQARLDQSEIKMNKGKATFILESDISQIITLSASWISGKSPLEKYSCLLKVGALEDLGRKDAKTRDYKEIIKNFERIYKSKKASKKA